MMTAAIRVLYVDDEPDLLNIGKMFLEQSGDFTVTTALSAQEGIRLLEQEKFDAIISDYQMPGMDGIHFLVEVRSRFGPIPFILFTGRGREEVVIQAINSGVDFYLQKGGEPGAQFAELSHKIKSAAFSKRADDALRKSEEQYRTILQTTMDGFWIIDISNGGITEVNETYCQMTGYSRAEMLNLKIPDLDASLTLDEQAAQIKNIIAKGSGIFETRHRRKDGSVFDVELSVTYRNTDGGKLICFCRDITERKRAEEKILASRDQLIRSESDLRSHKTELETQAEELKRAKLMLEESRDKFLDLYEFAPFGYLTLNNTGIINEANLNGAKLLGVERNKLVKARFSKFVEKTDSDEWYRFFASVLNHEEKQTGTLMLKRGDGSSFPARLESIRTSNSSDGLPIVRVTVSDISDIRLAEEALRGSERSTRLHEERLIMAQEIGRTGSWEYNLENNKIWGSAEGLHIFGFPRIAGDFPIDNIEACIPERERIHQALVDLIRLGKEYDLEYMINPADGSAPKIIHSFARLEKDTKGNPLKVMGVIQDITERKKVENEIQFKNVILSTQQETSLNAILIVDENGNILNYNHRFIETWGISDELLASGMDEPLLQFVVGQLADPEAFLSRVRYLYEHKAEKSFEEILLKDGRILERFSSPMLSEQGTYYGRVWYFRDITDRKRAEEALLFSRHSVDSVTETMVTITRDGHFADVNDAFCRKTGYSRDELLSMAVPDIDPDYSTETWSAYWNKLKQSGFLTIETTHHTKEGKAYPVEVTSTYFEYGGKEYQCAFARDITDRKRAEEELKKNTEELHAANEHLTASEEELRGNLDELTRQELAIRESEEKYRSLFAESRDGIVMVDEQGRFIDANPVYCAMLGYSVEELRTLSFPRITPEKWHAWENEEIWNHRLFKDGYTGIYEKEYIRKDGIVFPVELQAFTAFDPDSKVKYIWGIARDITERKRAEEALHDSEARYRTLVEHIPQKIFMKDRNSRYVSINENFANDLGIHPDEIVGKSDADLFPAKLAAKYRADDVRIIKTGKTEEFEERYLNEGKETWVHTIKTVVKDKNGEITGVCGVFWDITERKLAQVEILKKSEELAATGEELRAQFDALAENEQAMKESEAQKIAILNGITTNIAFVDKDLKVIWANKFAAESVNKSPAEMTGHTCHSFWGDPARPCENCPTLKVFETKQSAHIIQHTPDGRIWDEKGEPVFDENGNLIGVVEIAEDITGRKWAEEALRESELKYRSLIESSSDAIFCVDQNGEYKFTNLVFASTFDKTPDYFIGKTFWDIYPKEHADYRQKTNLAVFETGVTQIIEVEVPLPDTTLYFIAKANPIKDETGKVILNLTHATDITERKRAEEALREANGYLNNLFDYANAPIIVWNPEYVITRFNHAFEDLTLISAQEIIGQRLDVLFPKESRDHSLLQIKKTLEGERWETVEIPILTKDGSVRTVLWNSANVLDPDGHIISTIAQGVDITERKQAEEALREANGYLNNLFDYANAPIIVWNPEYVITRFNHAFEDLTLMSEQEVIGQRLDILFPKESRNHSLLQIKKTLEGERWETVEIPILIKDGSVRTVLWNSANVLDPDGWIISTIAQGVDITERKRAEEALIQANKKLTLLSSITRHDITNQITVLEGYLAVLKKKQTDHSLNEYCSKAATAAQRISAMIRFTKEYEQIGVNAPVWQDTRTLVDTAAKEVQIGKVMVKNDLPASAEVFADTLIAKVFYNLMDNAVRYGNKITTIRFSVEDHNGEQIIICKDDGDGVVAEEKEKIFERGFGKNTGLGLALAREILDITGITIRETGEPGKGARFEMTVPKGAYRSTGKGD